MISGNQVSVAPRPWIAVRVGAGIAVTGRQKTYSYLVSNVAISASMIDIVISAKARAFRDSDQPSAVPTCASTWLNTCTGWSTA